MLGGASILIDPLFVFFKTNIIVNSVILGVFMIGMIHAFRVALNLLQEVRWMDRMQATLQAHTLDAKPLFDDVGLPTRLCAPIAAMLGQKLEKGHDTRLPANVIRTFLDGVESRVEETRETGRYLVGLLVFLGLLGTFWGLLDTLQSVGQLIGAMHLGDQNLSQTLTTLKNGMQGPIDGMGVAFATSLFGLACSLVLGFFEMHAGQALNRFTNQLEEWLSTIAYIGLIDSQSHGAGQGAYVESLLEQMLENISSINRTSPKHTKEQVGPSELVSQFNKLVELQRDTNAHCEHMGQALQSVAQSLEAGSKPRSEAALRNTLDKLERSFTQLNDTMANKQVSKQDSEELRNELRVLSKTISRAALISNHKTS